MRTLDRVLFEHPAKVGEGYFEHLFFAWGFAAKLIGAGLAAFVHGAVPALCETTASQAVLDMNAHITARRAKMARGHGG